MSYPATGIKNLWRNDLQDVKRYLEEKHPEHFYVFNVSEKPYKSELFDTKKVRVFDHNWQDHHAPPFHMLIKLVDDLYKILKSKSTKLY